MIKNLLRIPVMNQRNRRRLALESLEGRLAPAGISFDPGKGEVYVVGTEGHDTVNVYLEKAGTSGPVVVVTLNGQPMLIPNGSVGVHKVYFKGWSGNDRFSNNTAIASEVDGDSGNDILIGGAGKDVFRGGDHDDWLMGRGGGDDLSGGIGTDLLFGDTAGSTLAYFNTAGQAQGALSALCASYVGSLISAWAPVQPAQLGQDVGDFLEGGDGPDILCGGGGDDRMYGDRYSNALFQPLPGTGDDWLFGEEGADWLYGGGGFNCLFGQSGADLLVGGNGTDVLAGGEGNDDLLGAYGNDFLYGEGGKDTLHGGPGDDYLDGGADGQKDILIGSTGKDTFVRWWANWVEEEQYSDVKPGEDSIVELKK
jgi:Ca2+-binding RTX toxin-like protein